MSKRKALSASEKRAKLMEIFYESGEVYQLKELEKLGPKKGIVQQSVKLVLQELVDNGVVRTEKIAGNVFYWAFQRNTIIATTTQLQESHSKIVTLEAKIYKAREELQEYCAAQSNIRDIKCLQQEVKVLYERKAQLQQKLSCNEIDFTAIKTMEKNSKNVLEAANRWTDNIFSIKSWCKRKFDKDGSELDKLFDIPEDLDYLNT